MSATYFTNYTVRFDGGPEIVVTEVDNSESLAIEQAQRIMRRSGRILNPDVLNTARVVYEESAD
jgi:hypothetical protein